MTLSYITLEELEKTITYEYEAEENVSFRRGFYLIYPETIELFYCVTSDGQYLWRFIADETGKIVKHEKVRRTMFEGYRERTLRKVLSDQFLQLQQVILCDLPVKLEFHTLDTMQERIYAFIKQMEEQPDRFIRRVFLGIE